MTSCEEFNWKEEKYSLDFVFPLIAFSSITSVTATLLNVLVILTVWRTPSLQTPSRILLCSLALSDLLIGAFVQPAFIFSCVSVLKKFYDDFCSVYQIASRIGYGLAAMSMFTLTVMSVDRFLAIKTKQKYKLIVTRKRCLILVVFLWTVPGTISMMIRFVKDDDENDTKIVVIFMIVLLLIITLLHFISFYHLKKISSQIANAANQPPSNQPASDFNIWKYKRSLVTMVMILGLILMSYLPMVFLFSTRTLSELLDDPGLLHLCESFVILNSTLNPILYLWRMKDVRQAVKNMIFQN